MTLQNQYDTKLIDATYDAIQAFEINTSYNDLSNVYDTLREDVEAAISTFMQSLAVNLGLSGYRQEQLREFVPAILFTLYDGYYIYSPTKIEGNDDEEDKYEYILKPYNYYTVRYKQDERNDVIINYTLDNYITVYGWINGKYEVRCGYLIANKKSVKNSETLTAIVPIASKEDNKPTIPNEQIYLTNENFNPTNSEADRSTYLYPRNDIFYIDPTSAKNYYDDSEEFNKWVKNNLDWITPSLAVRNAEKLSKDSEYGEYFNSTTDKIFVFNSANDPEDPTSLFAQHKTNVIRTSIQDNLNQAITAYSKATTSSYDYKLPKLDINEWEMVSTNVCMLTFLQGLPVGTKYYNNYSLVQSTTNKLYVSPNSLYFIINSDGDGYYHKIDCEHLQGNNITGYSSFDFLIKRVKINDEYTYYYKRPEKACYYCIVDSNYTPVDWENDTRYANRREAYYTALARERYRQFKSTDYLGIS